jgi:hypothetical protein
MKDVQALSPEYEPQDELIAFPPGRHLYLHG